MTELIDYVTGEYVAAHPVMLEAAALELVRLGFKPETAKYTVEMDPDVAAQILINAFKREGLLPTKVEYDG